MVPCPCSARRRRARSTTSRTSFTPAVTAESCSNTLLVVAAISLASVVFPVPGGPHRITDDIRSASISRRSGPAGPSRCSCPTTSSSDAGRIRAASGACRRSRSCKAAPNRSSAIPRPYAFGRSRRYAAPDLPNRSQAARTEPMISASGVRT